MFMWSCVLPSWPGDLGGTGADGRHAGTALAKRALKLQNPVSGPQAPGYAVENGARLHNEGALGVPSV